MFNKDVETAKRLLVEDVQNAPYGISEPFGHGVSERKIMEYVYACTMENIPATEAEEWLFDLYSNPPIDKATAAAYRQPEEEKKLFQESIRILIRGFKRLKEERHLL